MIPILIFYMYMEKNRFFQTLSPHRVDQRMLQICIKESFKSTSTLIWGAKILLNSAWLIQNWLLFKNLNLLIRGLISTFLWMWNIFLISVAQKFSSDTTIDMIQGYSKNSIFSNGHPPSSKDFPKRSLEWLIELTVQIQF